MHRQIYVGVDPARRGLVMLEIDGLGYHHIKAAIAGGRLTARKRLMARDDRAGVAAGAGIAGIILFIPGVLFAVLLPFPVQAMLGGAIFSLESLWLWLRALDW